MKYSNSILAILLLGVLTAGAQESDSSTRRKASGAFTSIPGKVLEVDAVGRKIVVAASKGGRINVTFDKRIEFKRVPAGETTLANASDIKLEEIAVGDSALVRGKVLQAGTSFLARQIIIIAQSDIAERQKKDRERWKLRGITGDVKRINPDTGRISILKKGDTSELIEIVVRENTSFQRYEANAVSLSDFKSSDISAIKEGDQIRVLGNRTADRQVIAEEIFPGHLEQ